MGILSRLFGGSEPTQEQQELLQQWSSASGPNTLRTADRREAIQWQLVSTGATFNRNLRGEPEWIINGKA